MTHSLDDSRPESKLEHRHTSLTAHQQTLNLEKQATLKNYQSKASSVSRHRPKNVTQIRVDQIRQKIATDEAAS